MVPVDSPVNENFAALVGSVPSLSVTPSEVASKVAILPVAPLAISGVAKVDPLLLTFKVKLSSANSPSRARVLNPSLNVRDAVLPAAALFTARSIDPALVIRLLVPEKTNLLVASGRALIPSSGKVLGRDPLDSGCQVPSVNTKALAATTSQAIQPSCGW